MSVYSRIRRQQLLQEAEGYLELVTVFADRWPVSATLRDSMVKRALEALSRLSDTDANRSNALALKGECYRVMERYEEAIAPLEKASKLDQESTDLFLALAWCYKRTGRLDNAIKALEEAIEVDRDRAIVYYNLACYWSLANNVSLTLAYLSQALDRDASYRDLVASEPDFDPVRNHPEFLALTSVIV